RRTVGRHGPQRENRGAVGAASDGLDEGVSGARRDPREKPDYARRARRVLAGLVDAGGDGAERERPAAGDRRRELEPEPSAQRDRVGDEQPAAAERELDEQRRAPAQARAGPPRRADRDPRPAPARGPAG